MYRHAPALGPRISRFALAPLLTLSLVLRMRALQRRTLRGIADTLALGRWRAFGLYVRSLSSFSAFTLDYLVMCRRGTAEIERRIAGLSIQGLEHMEQALASGRPILVTTMHMGNFQLGFLKLVDRLRPARTLSVFKMSLNDRNEDVLFQAFAKLGCPPTAMRAGEDGGRQAYLALRKGDIVAITIDLELQVKSRSVVRLKRTTGIPAAAHSSDRCEESVVEARMIPSTRYCISWSKTGSLSRSMCPVNSSRR